MKIALIGYGKMGREIEKIALQRSHSIIFIADENNAEYKPGELKGADVAIEFSRPEAATRNILKCFEANVPVVVGTTGWYDKFDEIKSECLSKNQSLFTATNFSVGVNILFELNRKLAELMKVHQNYKVTMDEIHHTQKMDSPSGTAITLAQGIIASGKAKKWICKEIKTAVEENSNIRGPEQFSVLSAGAAGEILTINAYRKENIPGTHIVKYESDEDIIEIRHEAKSRKGFATGAVLAAEWIIGKRGVFGMEDLLAA